MDSKSNSKNIDNIIHSLEERAKELNCLYTIEDILKTPQLSEDEVLTALVNVINEGWQFPALASVKIVYEDEIFMSANFKEHGYLMKADIISNDRVVGFIQVNYLNDFPAIDEGPFAKEERRLLNTIADRVGHYLQHNESIKILKSLDDIKKAEQEKNWRIILDMLSRTDPILYESILNRLLHNLCWSDIAEAEEFLQKTSAELKEINDEIFSEENKPLKKMVIDTPEYEETILNMADKYLTDDEIIGKVQKWINDDKVKSLVNAVENYDTSLAVISEELRKHYALTAKKNEVSTSIEKGLRVSLIRRFFTEEVQYISIAKEFVDLQDFFNLIDRIVMIPSSHGKLGGKSAGLFLASRIISKFSSENEFLNGINIPKTWFIPSDGIMYFLQYNNLEEVIEQKYKDIDEIRKEYPHIVRIFKNSQFPPEMAQGLSIALDDLGDMPLIVRSSSLLEDQVGAAFSGKYKSLFLANQGTKQERLNALFDAIAEVYASTFSPDPIEYRAERGFLDFHEEMGIMIMQVVGNKVGNYFFPSFAGVAFSNNEFRWSPRIKREDGLVRLVPGLGTRAVDRVSDDYPLLLAPGQPNLRVNPTVEEMLKYSPKKIDVINLKNNEFETREISDLIGEVWDLYPYINNVLSVVNENNITQPFWFGLDYANSDFVVTFDGLIKNTKFIKQINIVLNLLQEKMQSPVDIEFASDGLNFYLLQCRPQSGSRDVSPDVIPHDVKEEHVLFTANKFVSNGRVPDVSHIVYVDPEAYNEIDSRQTLLDIGKAVGKLNALLPKRRFILMGPGRWGSRGDIKLGVSVTYSDINNTSMLIEVARKKGNYVPDLSFGTHFFQDLVEASIRYLPLYPDENGVKFNEGFLLHSENIFPELLPEYAHLAHVIKVIDVPKVKDGMILKIYVNGDRDEALAIFTKHNDASAYQSDFASSINEYKPVEHWKWRYKMAETIVDQMDKKAFDVKAVYILGSTKNANAGPESDIDLLIHIPDYSEKTDQLMLWLDGWSRCISELNYLKSGYKTNGLLDVHFVTDMNILDRTSWAMKINAVTDAAKCLYKEK
ncbi:MAG TPA: PEP/pyruvate-binding domain-containing protein [Ignavibacteria bacterium]|nr:PEP/pyruvate-binding domain-containing protein [Ignavibacteria bacterium]